MKDRRIKETNGHMLALIWALAWPTMLEQLMQTAVQYIDTAMVGTLGTEATAAVGATTTVGWLIGSSIGALGVGFLSYIAKACGAGDTHRARAASAQAFLCAMIVGALFTALSLGLSPFVPVWMRVDPNVRTLASRYFFVLYLPMLPRTASIIFGTVLRAAGDTKTPMKIGVWVNAVNVVLNFFLIYPTRSVSLGGLFLVIPGAGMGVIGAAAASAVAFTVGGVAITLVLFRHPLLSPKGMSLRPNREILTPCLRVALPNMLQRFSTSFGYVAFASMINSLGEVATAAHTVANTVESLFYIPGFGMQTAAATLTGNAYGAGDVPKMKEIPHRLIPLEIGLMIVSGATLFLVAKPLVGLFSKSDEVVALGAAVLRMVALSEPFYGFSIIVEGMMHGVGRTREPFVYNVIGMWGIRIVGTFLCTQILSLGLVSAWGCMILHNMLLFVCFLVSCVRGTWNPLEPRSRKKEA